MPLPTSPAMRFAKVFGLLLVLLFPYLVNLGRSSIWDANEAFYAVTPREMMESGDYLSPTFNYRVRAQKPPLTYWAVVAFYKLIGVRELSVRLPGALAVLGLLAFVYGMGRILFGRTAGLAASALSATAFRILILARKLPIDILLLFWLMGSAFFIVLAARSARRWAWPAAYACMALGFMTKGPVAILIPLGSYLMWSMVAGRFSLSAMKPAAGALILAAIIVPWYLWTYVTHGWTYIIPFFLRDNLGRFASESFGPSRGLFFYIPTYLGDFFPWSILSMAAAYYAIRHYGFRQVFSSLELGLPLLWSVVTILFFSISKNKQEYYIAPAYPMMALFAAGTFSRFLAFRNDPTQLRWRQFWKCSLLVISALLGLIAVLWPFALSRMLPGSTSLAFHLPAIAILAGALFAALWAGKGRPGPSCLAIASSLWLALVIAAWWYVPHLEELRPVRRLCERISLVMSAEDEVGYYRVTVPSMAFYLRRPIFEEYDTSAMIRRLQSSKHIYCILGNEELDELWAAGAPALEILERRPRLATRLRFLLESDSADRELILVTNRPPTGSVPSPGP